MTRHLRVMVTIEEIETTVAADGKSVTSTRVGQPHRQRADWINWIPTESEATFKGERMMHDALRDYCASAGITLPKPVEPKAEH